MQLVASDGKTVVSSPVYRHDIEPLVARVQQLEDAMRNMTEVMNLLYKAIIKEETVAQ